ncbi:MAG: hypothetical protein GQ564_09445 [Bacteroidales bacterium]|nr:hypothetical protein [Bacteroidales bacterium]
MTKLVFVFLFLFVIILGGYSQDINILEYEIEEQSNVNVLITNIANTNLAEIIIYSSYSIDTIFVDSSANYYHYDLIFPKYGSYQIHIILLDNKASIIKQETSIIKVNKKVYLQKLEKILGPIIGAIIASLIFVLNNYLNQIFNKKRLTKRFVLKINSLIERTVNDLTQEYIDEILVLINNPDHPILLPFSNSKIFDKTNLIKRHIMQFQARKNSNIKSFAKSLKQLKL